MNTNTVDKPMVTVQSKLAPPSRLQEDCYYYIIWQHRDGRRIKFERGITTHSYDAHMKEVGWCQFCAGEIARGTDKRCDFMASSPEFYEFGPFCDSCKPIIEKRRRLQKAIRRLQSQLANTVPCKK